MRQDLDAICARFVAKGKLHITDLDGAQQAALRQDIFAYLSRRCVAWTYNAAYVEGLKRSVDEFNDVLKDIERQRTSNLKYSNRPAKESLHAKLFTGAVQKAITFGLDHGHTQFQLQIITDPIDTPVITMFKEELDDFLSLSEERELEAKAFDPATREVKRQAFTLPIEACGEWVLDLSGISYDIAIETSSLTVAADVLSNSVRYYLKQLQADHPSADLNGVDAMTAHPLQAHLYGTTANDIPWVDDAIYAHPNRPRDATDPE